MIHELSESNYEIITPVNIGNYHIDSRLSAGTFSVVFISHHIKTNDTYAMKVIPRKCMEENSSIYQLEQELRIMETSSHPNIVKLQEIIYHPENIYIVMEYCKCDLLTEILAQGLMDKSEIKRLFNQILNALSYLHHKGVSHHDLKPENILIDCKGNAKLTDFGSAFTKPPPVDSFGGTLAYIAPEAFSQSPYDYAKADIWTLGIVLYVMATTAFPWPTEEADEKILEHIMKADYHIPFFVDKEFNHIIKSCLQLDPLKRPTVDELLFRSNNNDGVMKQNTEPLAINIIAKNISTTNISTKKKIPLIKSTALFSKSPLLIRPKRNIIRNSYSLNVGFPVLK